MTGDEKVVTMNDVVAAMGKRVPAAGSAQKDFTANVILFVRKGTQPSTEDVERVNAVRAQFESFFANATGGRATLSTTVGSK